MKYRIGIDVGGTFTHAVAINAVSLDVSYQIKVPTTHSSSEGVATGVTQALKEILQCGVFPEDVVFIAHSTTQATNALLEGDVAQVGIIGMAKGNDAIKAKSDTNIENIEVSPGKYIHISHIFINSGNLNEEIVNNAIDELIKNGAEVIVAAESFSVDNTDNELFVLQICSSRGIPATASYEVSGLYGLKIRTRTAVMNASILPKMMMTAEMTAKAVKNAGIDAPLMIMRSDGGVMTIDEVRRRPILTILSGPAAGVAAALMYAKISDGVFIEVGGTSSDITCIRNGIANTKSATIGNHKLFLNTLDVRTIGIAGGSIVRYKNNQVNGVGPRSAHLAGLNYSAFEKISPENTVSENIQPFKGDFSDYLICKDTTTNKKAAITMTCVANAAGYVPENDYAAGNGNIAQKFLGDLLDKVLSTGCMTVQNTVTELLDEYHIPPNQAILIGGGGGAGVIVPYTGEKMMHLPWKIAENAPVISAIGVALALVRDVIERNIVNPSKEDILKIRREAIDAVIKSGADEKTVEVAVDIDNQVNIVRATATGSLKMELKRSIIRTADKEEMVKIAAKSMNCDYKSVHIITENTGFTIYSVEKTIKRLFGIIKKSINVLRVIDVEGAVRLQFENAKVKKCTNLSYEKEIKKLILEFAEYGDGGEKLPSVFILSSCRIINLSGLFSLEQVLTIAEVELSAYPEDEELIIVVGEQG